MYSPYIVCNKVPKMKNIQFSNIAGKSNKLQGADFEKPKDKFQSWPFFLL